MSDATNGIQEIFYEAAKGCLIVASAVVGVVLLAAWFIADTLK